MIDTEKVRLMTKITKYEKSDGVQELKINRYNRSAYFGLKILQTFLATTVVFGLIALLEAGYLLLTVISKGQKVSLAGIGLEFVMLYLVALAVSLVVTWIRSHQRYQKMQENIAIYEKDLQELQKYFNKEEGEE